MDTTSGSTGVATMIDAAADGREYEGDRAYCWRFVWAVEPPLRRDGRVFAVLETWGYRWAPEGGVLVGVDQDGRRQRLQAEFTGEIPPIDAMVEALGYRVIRPGHLRDREMSAEEEAAGPDGP